MTYGKYSKTFIRQQLSRATSGCREIYVSDCCTTSFGTVCTQRLGLSHYVIWQSVHREARIVTPHHLAQCAHRLLLSHFVTVGTQRPGLSHYINRHSLHTKAWIVALHHLAQCAHRGSDCCSMHTEARIVEPCHSTHCAH